MPIRRYSLLVLAPLLAMLVACAEDVPGIYIIGNQPLNDDCEPPQAGGAAGDTYLARGVLDLFITDQYFFAPLVQNTLLSSEAVDFGTGGGGGLSGNVWEANRVSLTRAVVTYDVPDALGVAIPRRLEIPLAAGMEPEAFASVGLEIVTNSIGRNLSASQLLRESGTSVTMRVRLKFFGRTNAGVEIDSNEFVYPIELCYGCLLAIPPDAIDPSHPVQPNCRNLTTVDEDGTETTFDGTTDQCFVGQDDPVDCRVVCPVINATTNGDPQGICEPQL